MDRLRLTEIKSLDETDEHPNGSFSSVLSTDALDRDEEHVDSGAFHPLPKSIPIFCDHEQWSVKALVARAFPYYEDGKLWVKGFFGSDPLSQEIRQKVIDGLIDSMSVGFRNATRMRDEDGRVHVTKAEIIEGSFVGVPANTEALVMAAKSADLADHENMADDKKDTFDAAEAAAIAAEVEALEADLEAFEIATEFEELLAECGACEDDEDYDASDAEDDADREHEATN